MLLDVGLVDRRRVQPVFGAEHDNRQVQLGEDTLQCVTQLGRGHAFVALDLFEVSALEHRRLQSLHLELLDELRRDLLGRELLELLDRLASALLRGDQRIAHRDHTAHARRTDRVFALGQHVLDAGNQLAVLLGLEVLLTEFHQVGRVCTELFRAGLERVEVLQTEDRGDEIERFLIAGAQAVSVGGGLDHDPRKRIVALAAGLRNQRDARQRLDAQAAEHLDIRADPAELITGDLLIAIHRRHRRLGGVGHKLLGGLRHEEREHERGAENHQHPFLILTQELKHVGRLRLIGGSDARFTRGANDKYSHLSG